MPLRNRVTPLGDLIADPARGLVYGNRGCLHDDHSEIRRYFATRRWIGCRLEFKGWHRHPLLQPGKFTELFFLDEATAFAAGHRPCALCRRDDYNRFLGLTGADGADEIDRRLHAERLDGNGRRLHRRPFEELPDGAFVLRSGEPWLVLEGDLLRWTPAGYTERERAEGLAQAITPPTMLEVLRSGWEPVVPLLHPTAAGPGQTVVAPERCTPKGLGCPADERGMRARIACIAAVALALAAPSAAGAALAGDADVAALQVGLAARNLYAGDIDGYAGPQTLSALSRLPGATTAQAQATRAALGGFGSHPLGSRPLVAGTSGWDVAALQFLLAWHGFPSGPLDGTFGARTRAALLGFQRWAGIEPIAVAGPQTLAALRQPPPASPVRLSAPIDVGPTDGFGPRGTRFHTGIDYPAPPGTPVVAARDGVVSSVGALAGYGNVVELSHEQGVTTLYAHLSKILVEPGRRVTRGSVVGLVGQTGDATGPHLHFELRLRGAAIDPAGALG